MTRLRLYFWRFIVMRAVYRADLWLVRLHTYAFAQAARAEKEAKWKSN